MLDRTKVFEAVDRTLSAATNQASSRHDVCRALGIAADFTKHLETLGAGLSGWKRFLLRIAGPVLREAEASLCGGS